MITINIYTVKQVKEKGARYDLDTKVIRSPRDAYHIIQTVLDLEHEACEKFGILTLNTKNAIAGVHIISIGNLNSSIVHPREVFKAAILNNAASIVCFHNHPSGNTTASQEDISITRRLIEVGELMGIEVLDHLIIGESQFVCLKEQGVAF